MNYKVHDGQYYMEHGYIAARVNLSELPRILDLVKCVNNAVVQSSCGLI